MNETVLESMVVRLLGDGSSYVQMLQQAQAQTQQAAQNIETATSRIESLSSGLQGFAQQALQVLSSFGVATSLKASFDKFEDFERQQIRLKAAIEASGRTATAVLPDYSAFTDEITTATLATRGTVTALIIRGEQMGLAVEKTKDIVRYSVALSAALGGEADSYFRAGMAIADNNYEMAAHMLGLRGMKDHVEAAHRVQNYLNAGFKTQSELLNTASGQLTKLQVSLAGLSREVGGMVAEAILPFIKGLRQVVTWLTSVDPVIKKATVTVIALFGAFLAAGPILAAFRSIASMVLTAILSPLGLIVMALAVVAVRVQQWADSVGGAAAAWEIVRARIIEVKDMALGWLGDFIGEHQRLTLVVGVVGAALVILVAAYQLLAFTVATVDGLLTLLYIKQAAQRVALMAWSAALRVAHVSLLLVSGLLNSALWLGSIIATNALVIAQTVIWASWRAAVFAAGAALMIYQGIVYGVRIAMMGANTAISIGTAALRLWHGAVMVVKYALLGFLIAAIAPFVAGFYLIKGVMAGIGYIALALKTGFMALWGVIKFGYAVVMSVVTVFKTMGTLEGLLYLATTALGSLFSGAWAVMVGIATGVQWLFNASLAAGTALETVFTFGLNLLIAAVAAVAAVLIVAVSGWAAWNAAVALTIGLLNGLIGMAVAVGAALATLAGAALATLGVIGAGLAAVFLQAKDSADGFLDVLLAIPGASGPLAQIGSMLAEWADILMGAYHAAMLMPDALEKIKKKLPGITEATTGLQLAWELVQEGFLLAVAQVKALWPPLWEFLGVVAAAAVASMQALWEPLWLTIQMKAKEAWASITTFGQTLWGTLLTALRTGWDALVLAMKQSFLQMFDDMAATIASSFASNLIPGLSASAALTRTALAPQLEAARTAAEAAGEQAEEAADAAARAGKAQAEAQDQLEKAIARANAEIERQKQLIAEAAEAFGVEDNAEIQAHKARIQELLTFVGQAVEQQKKDQEKSGSDPAGPYVKAEKEIKKYDAALVGSAEAYAHVAEYMERLSGESGGPLGKGHHGKTEVTKPHAPEAIAPPAAPRPIEPARPPAFDDRVPTKLDLIATILAAIRDQKNGNVPVLLQVKL